MMNVYRDSSSIADKLRAAGAFSHSPRYSLFAYKHPSWELLSADSDPHAIASLWLQYAISGEHGDSLEIRCNGVRVKL